MQALLLVVTLTGMPAGSWCSEENWDKKPFECLTYAELNDRYLYFDQIIGDIAQSQHIARLSSRPGGLLSKRHAVEVWHLGVGQYQIRIRPDRLRDMSDDMLMYYGAHEICHIVNGDAGYGTWDAFDEKEKLYRHRWVRACSFAIVGDEVLRTYLAENETGYSQDEQEQLFVMIKSDSEYWLKWRLKKQRAAP